MVSAIGDVSRAARRVRRGRAGEDQVPAVWYGRVYGVRNHDSEAGPRAGVYVTVPRLTGGEVHGPVPWVGDRPAAGDPVLVAAVEGMVENLAIIGRIWWGTGPPVIEE